MCSGCWSGLFAEVLLEELTAGGLVVAEWVRVRVVSLVLAAYRVSVDLLAAVVG